MKKISYIFIFLIGLCLGMVIKQFIPELNADLSSVMSSQNMQKASYEIMYVNGCKYIIFSNSSGSDIEVFRLQ